MMLILSLYVCISKKRANHMDINKDVEFTRVFSVLYTVDDRWGIWIP